MVFLFWVWILAILDLGLRTTCRAISLFSPTSRISKTEALRHHFVTKNRNISRWRMGIIARRVEGDNLRSGSLASSFVLTPPRSWLLLLARWRPGMRPWFAVRLE